MPRHINSQTGKDRQSEAKQVLPTALLLGAGYTARAIAPALQKRGYQTIGTTRSQSSAAALSRIGIVPLITPSLASDSLRDQFEKADIIISSIPPNKSADSEGLYDPVLSVLRTSTPRAKWVGYLSATSVYGDRQGQWAFEGEPASPKLKRGIARAEAELEWLETGWPVHIFRLAGIYGPGRNPFEKLKEGTARAVIKDGHVVNRIHIDDIVRAVLASIDKPKPQIIYNIADGNPAPPQDVLDYAAQLIGAKLAPRVEANDPSVSKMARTFYSETKRIDISRAQTDLDWTPLYPDYKSGLTSILKA
jgi:nucleoside-diphosphate-sugar epimerase